MNPSQVEGSGSNFEKLGTTLGRCLLVEARRLLPRLEAAYVGDNSE
jgi:hypothetical protein